MRLHLLPAPQVLALSTPGKYRFPPEIHLVLPPHPTGRDLFAAEQFALRAQMLTGSRFHISSGPSVDRHCEIRLVLDGSPHPDLPDEIRAQSYTLQITPGGIAVTAGGGAGLFYALQTLLQILREVSYQNQRAKSKKRTFFVPCLTISDYPDFARRGVYHDTARGKVPTVETLLQLIDDLAHLKYNEFQLYIENNFQFRRHPEMHDDTDPFTSEELLQLDAACRARHIDFVPSLTSLGHFEKILSRPKFRHLAEAEPEQLKSIGAPVWHDAAPWSLCVTDPEAKQLLADMYGEFAPQFSSGQFNICCDEAYDLGRVRSKALADKIGTGQIYVDWINYCDGLVKENSPGTCIQMWGDIILNHPELIPQLPADATLLEWGYEHDHKFDEHCEVFAQRLKANAKTENRKPKIENRNLKSETRNFYVAPGTSSWLTLSAHTRNACGNIHAAAVAGLKYGARGMLVTDWGDHGHQQMLSVSLLPFAYGAAAGWNLAATPNPIDNENSTFDHLLAAISSHLFLDPAAALARIAYDLGLTYERLGWQRFNASLDHFLFREKWDFANYVNRAPAAALRKTIRETWRIYDRMHQVSPRRPDGTIVTSELFFTCRMIIHTCQRTLLRQQWLAADPARRNPEEPALAGKSPKPLPKDFARQMERLGREIRRYKAAFESLWLARNKRSRMEDVTAEFRRLAAEYKRFAR